MSGSRPASGASRNDGVKFASGASQQAMIEALTAAGYYVFKIGTCRYGDRPHGRHGITTRTAMCPGSDPLPHGFQSVHMGSFGMIMYCQCGESFPDYRHVGEATTPWEAHKAEHGIDA